MELHILIHSMFSDKTNFTLKLSFLTANLKEKLLHLNKVTYFHFE